MIEAGMSPGIAAWLHDNPGTPVRADVDEGTNAAVFTPRHDQGDVSPFGGTEIEDLCHFAFVANKVPNFLENVLALVREDFFIVIDTPADVVPFGKGRRLLPSLCRS